MCYFGIDLNSTSCLQAEENLAALHAPYTINIINEGILEVDPDSLPKFDIIIMAHVHYYFSKDLRSLFAKAMKLCQPHSERIEVIAIHSLLTCGKLGRFSTIISVMPTSS